MGGGLSWKQMERCQLGDLAVTLPTLLLHPRGWDGDTALGRVTRGSPRDVVALLVPTSHPGSRGRGRWPGKARHEDFLPWGVAKLPLGRMRVGITPLWGGEGLGGCWGLSRSWAEKTGWGLGGSGAGRGAGGLRGPWAGGCHGRWGWPRGSSRPGC